jgi:hypothetical protein
MSGIGTRPTAGQIPVAANRQALADALLGIPSRIGRAFTNMAQQGLAANERFMQGEGANQPFLPSMDSGGRLGELASFITSNMAMGGPAGTLGAGPSMARKASALPMDEASRMARAAKQGYHTDLYHGTGSDISAFERGRRGLYATDRPEIADIYARMSEPGIGRDVRAEIANAGPNVMPLKLRGDVLEISDMGPTGNGWSTDNLAAALGVDMGGGRMRHRDLMNIAKERGYTAVKIKDMQDLGGQQDQWSILDPAAIRSRFAAFDPAKRNSTDLLASYGPNPLSAALYGQPQE